MMACDPDVASDEKRDDDDVGVDTWDDGVPGAGEGRCSVISVGGVTSLSGGGGPRCAESSGGTESELVFAVSSPGVESRFLTSRLKLSVCRDVSMDEMAVIWKEREVSDWQTQAR